MTLPLRVEAYQRATSSNGGLMMANGRSPYKTFNLPVPVASKAHCEQHTERVADCSACMAARLRAERTQLAMVR